MNRNGGIRCNRIHYKAIITPFTQMHLGDCSYLSTCRRQDTCKFVHYDFDLTPSEERYYKRVLQKNAGRFRDDFCDAHEERRYNEARYTVGLNFKRQTPIQWINADVRDARESWGS